MLTALINIHMVIFYEKNFSPPPNNYDFTEGIITTFHESKRFFFLPLIIVHFSLNLLLLVLNLVFEILYYRK